MEQKSPLDSPEAAALLKDPTAIRSLLRSQETRQLIALLQQQGDLNAAAQQARSGDIRTLQSMLGAVGQSKEGEQVLSSLEKKLKK